MNRQEISDRVMVFLGSHLNDKTKQISEDSQLMGDLGFDSLKLLLMANDAEDAFNVIIDDAAMKRLLTVGDIIDFLEENA